MGRHTAGFGGRALCVLSAVIAVALGTLGIRSIGVCISHGAQGTYTSSRPHPEMVRRLSSGRLR